MRRTDDVSLWPWTLTCGWCVSSFSICIPSLKFVGLAIRKIWRTMCVSINGPGDRDLWPFDLETGMRVAFKVGNLPSKFGHARPLGSRIIHYVCNGRTDKRTDKSNAYCPLPYGGGGIIIHKYLAMYGALIYLEALFYSPLSNQSIILYFLFSPLR